MTVIVWVIRVIFILLVLRFVLRFVAGMIARTTAPAQRRGGGERPGGTLVRDPQCGTYIPETRALRVGSGSATQHFCSATCRDAWLQAHGT